MLRDILTLSALILAVLLVRAAFKNRVPKRMIYCPEDDFHDVRDDLNDFLCHIHIVFSFLISIKYHHKNEWSLKHRS